MVIFIQLRKYKAHNASVQTKIKAYPKHVPKTPRH